VGGANTQLIERFYGAFAKRDADTMAACYAPDVHFSDPVFPDLRGPKAGAMWRMLTSGPGDARIELLEHDADGAQGTAHWRAHYTFTETGRPVVNDIQATFRFDNGLLLGWTPFLRSKVRAKAGGRLDEFTRART